VQFAGGVFLRAEVHGTRGECIAAAGTELEAFGSAVMNLNTAVLQLLLFSRRESPRKGCTAILEGAVKALMLWLFWCRIVLVLALL
jgi:hypothetical protein